MSTPRPEEVYLDEPYLSIFCDREHKSVLSVWKGFSNTSEFRAGSLKVMQAIRETHAASLVIDNRKSEGITPADQLWVRDSLVGMMEVAGLRRLAVVVAQHGLAKIATDDLRGQTAKSVIVTRAFGTETEALDWATA